MNDEEKNKELEEKEQMASSSVDETNNTTDAITDEELDEILSTNEETDESSMEVEDLYTRRTGVIGNSPLANQLKEINVLFQEIDDLKKRKQELNNEITKSYKEGMIYADETKESLRELFAVRRQMTIRKELQSIFGFDVIDFYKKVHNRDYSIENYINMIEQIEKTMKKENPIETTNIRKVEFKITNKEKKELKELSKNWNELFITITHNDERKDTVNKIENLLTNAINNGALNRFEKYNYYDTEQSKTLTKLGLNKWDIKGLLSPSPEVAELPLVTDTYLRLAEKELKRNKKKINKEVTRLFNKGKENTEAFKYELRGLREINHQLNVREAIAKMTGIDIDKFGEKYISKLGIRPDDKVNLWRAKVSTIFKDNEGFMNKYTFSRPEKFDIELEKKKILSIYNELKQFDNKKDWENVKVYTERLMTAIDRVIEANTKIIAKEYNSNAVRRSNTLKKLGIEDLGVYLNDQFQVETPLSLEEMTPKEKEQRPLEDTVSIASSGSSTIELSEDEPSNPGIPLDKQAKVIKELTYHQGGIDNLRKRKQELNKNVTEAYKKGDIYTEQTKADLRELLELRYQMTLRKELQLIFGFDVIDFYRKATVQRKQLNGENYINMMEQIEKIVGKVQDNTIETINGKNSTFVLSKEEKTNFQNLIKGWDTKVTFMTRGDIIEGTAREIDEKIVKAVENGALDQFKKHHYYDVSQSKTLTNLGLNKWDIKELLSFKVEEIPMESSAYSCLSEKYLNESKYYLNEWLTKKINQGEINTKEFNEELGRLREIHHELNVREALAKMTGIDIDKFGETYISTLGVRPDIKTILWRTETSAVFKENEGSMIDYTLSGEEIQKIEEGKKNILSIYNELKQFDKKKDWGNVRNYTQKLMTEIDHVVKANTKIIAKEYHSNDFKIDKGVQASIEDFSPGKEVQHQFKDTSLQEPKIVNRESIAGSPLPEEKTSNEPFVGNNNRDNLPPLQNRKEELTVQIKKTFQELIDLVGTENEITQKINVNEKSMEELYTDYLKVRGDVSRAIDYLIMLNTDSIEGIMKEADRLREKVKEDPKIYDGLTDVIDLYNENFTRERLLEQTYEEKGKNIEAFSEYLTNLARLENMPLSCLTQRADQISDLNDQCRKIWNLDIVLDIYFDEFNSISKTKETGKEPITTLQAEQIEARKVNASFELKIKNASEIPINPNKDQLQDGNEQLDSVQQTRKTTIEELKKKLSLNHSSSATIQSNLNNKLQVKGRKNQLEQIM